MPGSMKDRWKLSRKVVEDIDARTELPVYGLTLRGFRVYTKSSVINRVRRVVDFVRGYITSRIIWREPTRLHLGCGGERMDDAINIDYLKSPATDYVLDATTLPFPTNSVTRIESYHMVEHIPRAQCIRMFESWHELLVPGGKLVIEIPDFDVVIREYLDAEDTDRIRLLLEYVFGGHRHGGDVHHWGWNFERLREVLEQAEFNEVREEAATDKHSLEAPCLRVIATA